MENKDIKKLMEDFYNEHPNARLKSFINEIKRLENIEKDNQQKIEDWYKSLVGKYFFIDNTYYIEVKSDENGEMYTNEVRITGYDYSDVKNLDVSIMENCEFIHWLFKNPYKPDPYYDDKHIFVEITKEEYERVLEMANMFIELGKQKQVVEDRN